MPLTNRERKAIWLARQHYFLEFLTLFEAASTYTQTPTGVQAALKISLEMIRDRIDAEDPDLYIQSATPAQD